MACIVGDTLSFDVCTVSVLMDTVYAVTWMCGTRTTDQQTREQYRPSGPPSFRDLLLFISHSVFIYFVASCFKKDFVFSCCENSRLYSVCIPLKFTKAYI